MALFRAQARDVDVIITTAQIPGTAARATSFRVTVQPIGALSSQAASILQCVGLQGELCHKV